MERAKTITSVLGLSDKSLQCINFELQEKLVEGKKVVAAREINDESCGGDAATSARVFRIAFELDADGVWTDAKSPDGKLEKLEEQKRRD